MPSHRKTPGTLWQCFGAKRNIDSECIDVRSMEEAMQAWDGWTLEIHQFQDRLGIWLPAAA